MVDKNLEQLNKVNIVNNNTKNNKSCNNIEDLM